MNCVLYTCHNCGTETLSVPLGNSTSCPICSSPECYACETGEKAYAKFGIDIDDETLTEMGMQ